MKLYYDIGNNHALKALIASGLSGIDLQLQAINLENSGRLISGGKVPHIAASRLPILELSADQFLFSPNAICSYLLGELTNSKEALLVDEWLEWESTQLQSVLAAFLVNSIMTGKIDQMLTFQLMPHLNHLDVGLQGKDFLIESRLTAADVAVWCALYPLVGESHLWQLFAAQYPAITQWFDQLLQKEIFQSSILQLTLNKGSVTCKTSVLAQPVPPSANLDTRKLKFKLTARTSIPVNDNLNSNQKLNSSEDTPPEKASLPEEIQPEKSFLPEEIHSAYNAWVHGHELAPKPAERKHPILPKKGEKNILITSSLPYVNNVPHLGNIIGCVLSADVYSRFCQLRNYNVLYICGTDEYGTATETKALEEGITPQEICDKYFKLHSEIYQWFNIHFDYFGRTTTPWQTKISQDIFWKLHQNGYLLTDSLEQLHCESCNIFLADRYVEGICPFCTYEDARGDQCDKCGKLINSIELKSPRCKLCKSHPVVKSSEHLFLDLPKIEPKLSAFLDKSWKTGLWTSNAQIITQTWIRDGLKPRCITRDLKWGTPVPLEGFQDKVFYVWFDAPIGYLSITANYTNEWEKWWKNPKEVDLFNFMAKDNVPFHGVIFPCSLIGSKDNYTIVNHLIATEYLNYEDGKFSKSRGVGVFGNDVQSTSIPADIWRFYLLYIRPENQDTVFSWSDFVLKNNSELLNNLGNFINRSLAFLANNFKGLIPKMSLVEDDKKLLAHITRELHTYLDLLEKVRLRDAIRHILNISRLGNQHIQATKPWVLIKGNDEERERCGTIIGLAANISCLLSVMIQPYMPVVSKTIQEQLDAPDECNVLTPHFICFLKEGHKIGQPKPLFNKIEQNEVNELKKQFAGVQSTSRSQSPASKDLAANPILCNEEAIEKLKAEVSNQGEVVRKLKAEKADKADIDGEVVILLELKKKLTLCCGEKLDSSSQGNKKKNKKVKNEIKEKKDQK